MNSTNKQGSPTPYKRGSDSSHVYYYHNIVMKKTLTLLLLAAICQLASADIHFPLDEAAGVTGAIVMPGARGNALRLNGYTSYLKKNYDAESVSTTQQTISLWCAVETYPMMNAMEAENAYSSIIETINETDHTGFAIRLSSQGNLRFECYSDGWKQSLDADRLLPKYQWNHIVVTLDVTARQIKMYNNGELIAEGKTMNSLSAGNGTMLIGKEQKTLTFSSFIINLFNGLIDDIRIDNHIWSADRIADNTADNPADLIFPQDAFYKNNLRPHFHGMPMMGWTNETHGLVYADGKYHLFFQKNPNGPYMARLHWGHLVSEDLCGWDELPIAVAPSESYDMKGCWSGCVFRDEQLTGGKPWIAYTGVDNARATIDFAMPDDDLLEWTKADNNPRINGRPAGLTDDFRDPYFFRNGDKAYIIVGSSKNGVGVATLHAFNANGSLTNDGTLFYSGTDAATSGTFFEMPNLTKIGDKWLFTVTPLGSNSGVRTIYWVGTINPSGQFVPDNATPRTVELSGMAREGYGMLSPSICQVDGKTIALGIVPDKLSSAANYDMGWAHNYSLPREWSLTEDGTLLQKPYEGLTALRTSQCYTATDIELQGTQAVDNVTDGMQVEVDVRFVVGGGNAGIRLLSDGNKAMKIYYEPAGNRVIVDMRDVSRRENDKGVFDGLYASVLPDKHNIGDTISLHLYFDHSVLDLFVDNKWASSIRVFPAANVQNGVELYATAKTKVATAAVYNLETTVQAKSYNLVTPEADNTGSALEQLTGNGEQTTDAIYNVLGMKVSPADAHGGIFIQNGKKTYIK